MAAGERSFNMWLSRSNVQIFCAPNFSIPSNIIISDAFVLFAYSSWLAKLIEDEMIPAWISIRKDQVGKNQTHLFSITS